MEKIIDHYFPCFGSWAHHPSHGPSMQAQQHLESQQPSDKGAAVPYQNNLAGQMTYTGTSHAKDLRKQSRPHELTHDLSSATSDRAKTVMAWDDGCQDLDLSHAGIGRGAAEGDEGTKGKHIRFQPNAPTRASTTERTFSAARVSPPPASAFEIADVGDVSPISLESVSSQKERTPMLSAKAVAHNPRPLSAKKTEFVSDTANPGTHIKTLCDKQGLIGPVPRQVTRLPSTKAGKPTLSLMIPPSTAPLPVEKSTLSDSSPPPPYPATPVSVDEGEDEAESGSGSANTTPIDTPAHARRFPAQEGTRAAKPPKKVSLSDELKGLGVGSAGAAVTARDFAYEQ
ncbi:MAG: hypothetical protein Q9183_006982 [Haloplaca sp. 2 TL-2023]